MTQSTIHVSKYGTYHPKPGDDVAWTVNDTRGYIDGGPACDECGACECWSCGGDHIDSPKECECVCTGEDKECVGLSFVYVCLDGGEALCQACFDKDGTVEVIACDCAE